MGSPRVHGVCPQQVIGAVGLRLDTCLLRDGGGGGGVARSSNGRQQRRGLDDGPLHKLLLRRLLGGHDGLAGLHFGAEHNIVAPLLLRRKLRRRRLQRCEQVPCTLFDADKGPAGSLLCHVELPHKRLAQRNVRRAALQPHWPHCALLPHGG